MGDDSRLFAEKNVPSIAAMQTHCDPEAGLVEQIII